MSWLASAILLTAFAGLWRISHADTTADRLLGLQMLGTTGIAFLLVMAQWLEQAVWREVALILALLAAVITVALVQLLRGRSL
jgi:multicomponent Na+:H+ antiporter subunit F